MKKLMLLVVFCLLCSLGLSGYAEEVTTVTPVPVTEVTVPAVVVVEQPSFNLLDVLKKIPALKQGVAYSVIDSRFNYITTFDVFNYKGGNLEVGYSGIAKNTGDKIVAVLSYDLWNAKGAGVTIPVLDLIKFRPGVYAGVGRIGGSNEVDYGISATIIDVKF